MTVTEETAVEIAVRTALVTAKRWGWCDGFDWIGPAWVGVDRANRRGCPRKALPAAGVNSIIDFLRVEKENPEKARNRTGGRDAVHVSGHEPVEGGDGCLFDYVPDRPRREDERAGMREFWAETRAARNVLSWLERVTVYLRYVECWTQAEIARVLLVSESAVSFTVRRAAERLSGKRPAAHSRASNARRVAACRT